MRRKAHPYREEAARNAFDALFIADGSAVALPAFEPTSEEAVEDSLKSEGLEERKREPDASGASEEDPPKRKRSRRRRRGRGGRKTEKDQTTGEQVSAGSDELNEEKSDKPEEVVSARDGEEKPRRRRPRRRSRKSEPADHPARNGESRDLDTEEDELSDEQTTGSRGRGHRNLPTWTEAVGVIVDANIELHEKTPNKSSSPRGRGRGGRRRKKS